MSRISKCFLAVICLVMATAAEAQRLKEGTKPIETSVAGFAESYCSTVGTDLRVCRARTSDDGDAQFLVHKKGVLVNTIDGQIWSTAASTPDAFIVYLGDLDRSGGDELIIVSLDSVSLGLGVSNSSVFIFDASATESKGAPIRFTVQEFGGPETLVYDPKTRQTDILITYWSDFKTLDAKRGPGLYLVGKWFRYNNKRLQPLLDRPILARRYLNSFAAERNNDDFADRRPNTWLKHRSTHKLRVDPYEAGTPRNVQTGTIESVTEAETVTFKIRLEGGETVTLSSDRSEGGFPRVDSIGVWQDKFFLYPVSYSGELVVDAFFGPLEGRRVRIETYAPEGDEEFTRVWLLRK